MTSDMIQAADLLPGDIVTVEDRPARQKPRTVTGVVALDEEGSPRVVGVPLYVDQDGYLLPGITLISVERPTR